MMYCLLWALYDEIAYNKSTGYIKVELTTKVYVFLMPDLTTFWQKAYKNVIFMILPV